MGPNALSDQRTCTWSQLDTWIQGFCSCPTQCHLAADVPKTNLSVNVHIWPWPWNCKSLLSFNMPPILLWNAALCDSRALRPRDMYHANTCIQIITQLMCYVSTTWRSIQCHASVCGHCAIPWKSGREHLLSFCSAGRTRGLRWIWRKGSVENAVSVKDLLLLSGIITCPKTSRNQSWCRGELQGSTVH